MTLIIDYLKFKKRRPYFFTLLFFSLFIPKVKLLKLIINKDINT